MFGKSNAAKWLAWTYWTRHGRRSLVLDPTTEPGEPHGWPPCCLVVQGEGERPRDHFRRLVFEVYQGCAVFFDEGGEVERDRALNPYFTRIRHRYHVFHYIGHNYTDILPKQRNQLGTLLLFYQPAEPAAAMLAREWSTEKMLESSFLPKYQFLYCRRFGAGFEHIIERRSLPPFSCPPRIRAA